MKFFVARGPAILAIAALLPILAAAAQSAQPAQTQPQVPAPKGQVIFSRSTGASGQTTTQAGPAAQQPSIQLAGQPTVQDAERRAVTVTALNLDVHLEPVDHHIAVRALVAVRNDGKTPLPRIPLQISSDLHWDQVRVEGRDVPVRVATLNSDADHTGQLHEAEIPLAEPLAAGATLKLDVGYSGAITATAKRLTAVGTPPQLAIRSDWDEISQTFTGLRGFGDVVWYPVSSVPAILGDGNRLFEEIGTQKLRMQGAPFTLHLAVEFRHGQPPTIALVNGEPVPLHVHDAGGLDPEVLDVATASVQTTVGFQAPSLFVAMRADHPGDHPGDHVDAWATPDNDPFVAEWLKEAAAVSPFLEQWLGRRSSRNLTLLDTPDPNDAPFETGSLLVVPLGDQTTPQLDSVLVHALTHAWLHRPPAWLDEGVATFLSTVWVEQHQGREKALEMLEAQRMALALAEPSSPGESAGEPLPRATDPIYFRTKAAYVFWMLRDLAGDGPLAQALQAWAAEPQAGAQPGSASFQDLLKKAGVTRDLSWFFAGWVNADKGLPDLSIVSVYPTAAQSGSYLVAVNLANQGYVAAEVPLTVRSTQTSVTQRILVPARGRVVRRLLIVGRPTEVRLNDGTVPESQASVHIMHLDDKPTGSSSQIPGIPQ
ncbi:MAG TPA: hypothetical protein VFU55_08185 [Terracidiphilus sp.]|nr:hypothetical protein [Terracidiphilus sp.]